MIGYIQLLVALLTLGREILKYLESQQESKMPIAEKKDKAQELKAAVVTARETGDTSDVEKLFGNLWAGSPRGVVSDK